MILNKRLINFIEDMTSDVVETNNQPLTLESMMAAFNARMTRYEEAWEKRNVEWEKRNAEWEKSRAESNAEWEKRTAKIDKQIAENYKLIGGMGNNNGDFAQEFFFNALYHGNRILFGQEFHEVMPEVRRYSKNEGLKSEYDVMLINGQSVCIVEVKYKADTDDVAKTLKKEASFRANFPEFANRSLYLALASLSFHKKVEKECRKQGVAIIKQLGKTIEVFDENLKVF